jgi:hypothetical protein
MRRKRSTRKSTEEIDEALTNRAADEHEKDSSHIDKAFPNERYSTNIPTRFALQLPRFLVTETKKFTLKKGYGRDGRLALSFAPSVLDLLPPPLLANPPEN